ncbi:MAG: alpha/beta fold hydrolase [Acidobacteriota bacterium]
MRLHFRIYGEGPPLIILHGLLGSAENWHSISRHRLASRLRVFALDLRNHGKSPHHERFDYPAMVEDLLEFYARHDLDSACVLGHSMGGKAAMQLALSHTDRVDKLITVDIAPKSYPPEHLHILEALQSLDLERYNARQEVDSALAERIRSRTVRQFLLKNLVRGQGLFRWQMDLENISRNYDALRAGLPEDGVFLGPALFIRGERSNYVQEEDLDLIHRLFPNAELKTIPEAGHWVHADQPEEFARAVIEFVQPHERR